MRTFTVLASAAGLCLSASLARAQDAVSLTDPGGLTGSLVIERGLGWADVSMSDGFDHFGLGPFSDAVPLAAPPTSFSGPANFRWGANRLTGRTAVPAGSIATAPSGSRAVRLRTTVAADPGQFLVGVRHEWPALMRAAVGVHARVGADLYVTTLDQLYSFEPGSAIEGAVAARMIWGGQCAAFNLENIDCAEVAPGGAIGVFLFLSECLIGWCDGVYQYWPGRYCTNREGTVDPACTPPPFADPGDMAQPVVNAWFRLGFELTEDGRRLHTVDFFDGTGEHAFALESSPFGFATTISRLWFNSSYEVLGADLFLDNVHATGQGIPMMAGQPALACPYENSLDYLPTGNVQATQTLLSSVNATGFPVVRVAQHSGDAPGNLSLVLNSAPLDETPRLGARAAVPAALSPTLSNDVAVAVDLRHDNGRERRVELPLGDEGLLAVALGDPLEPMLRVLGAQGETVLDAAWPGDSAPHRLGVRLSASGAVRVFLDGAFVGGVAGAAGVAGAVSSEAVRSVDFVTARGGLFTIDNLSVRCDAPSCATDFDFDFVTTFADLNAVLSNFGQTPGTLGFPGDADGDGDVTFADLNATLSAFGTSCE